ncbi:conserved hypothetical protein; putative signal peptide [Bradyrhizobium sp. ORS 285]|uniref:BA14K family protein n=1 Tax=Bradyrhizobium sp. ORS 285 TaxID=115808 RepID=UPI000240A587|nr:BA14K family protein [Bradyrhizobium sp. ORS 285]CCD85273.1 conserved exported hypothetical protein [Bradyrhizobium sp. ORS 285]SMX57476.1 conserved hypothetical protein; putative signal peptide [Bradyrhizobium sp. ORS 285]
MQLRKLLTVAAIGTMTLSAVTPLAAAPMMPNNPAPASAVNDTAGIQQVQYRHWRGGHDWHPGLGRRHGYQYGYRHHHNGSGAAVLGGLAAGAIIGGAIANSRAQAGEAETYCAQRYRSYDPRSGTYLGNDGRRRSCP